MSRRVLFYSDTTGFGGAEVAMIRFIERLDRSRWEPWLAYEPTPASQPLGEAAAALDVPCLPVASMEPGRRGVAATAGFARLLRRLRPAVLHGHLTWQLASRNALITAVLARVPCVVATVHLFVDVPIDRSTRWQQAALSRQVDRYLAVSHHVARASCRALGWPADRVHVVHNGVDLATFGETPDPVLRAALRGDRAGPLVLVPARLAPQKGHGALLEAAREVPAATFALAGDGPDRRHLERLARRLEVDDRVIFLGARRDMPRLYAASDMVALPSLYEGLPLAVLEGMAAARPIVATAVGGTDEAVVQGRTGLLVPAGDPKAFAAAIRQLTADPATSQRLGDAGRRRVERTFSAAAMVAAVTGHYEEILQRRSRRASALSEPALGATRKRGRRRNRSER